MRVQNDSQSSSGVLLGVVILVIGVLIGAVVAPSLPGPSEKEEEVIPMNEVVLQIPVARPETPEEPPENDLGTIEVELSEESSRRLQEVYDRAMRMRHIVQEEGDLVPATIKADGKVIDAMVRIKGDFLDHINTDKWSLRVELESDKLWGMSRFSIQHPKTRAYLWEWLIMQVCRREGLLAPRAEFVNVVMNGNATGIYYLEEHFTKELLESQGRREGPITRFVEDTFLDAEAQYVASLGYMSETVSPAMELKTARVAAYGEKRLAQREGLGRQLQQALEIMRELQRDPQGLNTHNLLDIPSNALLCAFFALFRTSHGAIWKSRRYYHDPVTARLQPIVFDTGAGRALEARDPFEILKWAIPSYIKNDAFYHTLFREIGRISTPEYVDDLLATFGPQLRQIEGLLRAEGLDDPFLDASAIEAELRRQQVYLHKLLHPRVPVSFDCRLLTTNETADRPEGTLEVEAWATTRVPVVVDGFRFDSGQFVAAGDLAVQGRARPLAGSPDSVVLPKDGSHVIFRFPTDERSAVLRDLDELKSAVASGGEMDRSLKLTLQAVSRLITSDETLEEQLKIRKFAEKWSTEGGRPDPPQLEEALEKHGCLRFDSETERLELVPGTHAVQGDLVVPAGYPLYAGPGVTLRFDAGRALISEDPLFFEGTEAEPIVLEPKQGQVNWAGVAVMQPNAQSLWRHVTVRHTDVIRRGGWMMTGGITFYHAPVELFDCRFEDAHGEDALNIFGVPFLMDGIVIDRVASDAFDGDFVTGEVIRSTFIGSVEDAVDVSGSEITVTDCTFREIGDKAVSAGEDSTVHVRDCLVESASIGVASKDFSRVDVIGLDVRSTINYGFAVYIKKKEFGPSSIVAEGVSFGEMGLGEFIVQETCSLELNGAVHGGVPLDVKELYRQKILGQ